MMNQFGRTGSGRPGTSGTIAAPFRRDRTTSSGIESRCRGPPCRRQRTDPTTPVRTGRRCRWQAGCPTKPSTRRSLSSDRLSMRTGAAEAGQTWSGSPVADVPRAAPATTNSKP